MYILDLCTQVSGPESVPATRHKMHYMYSYFEILALDVGGCTAQCAIFFGDIAEQEIRHLRVDYYSSYYRGNLCVSL
jgi:hypothetical protein